MVCSWGAGFRVHGGYMDTRIHVHCVSSDARCQVRAEKGGGISHLLGGHIVA